MRLLRCDDDGRLSFTRNLISRAAIPPYAILSHTWQNDEEVTYNELIEGGGINKEGYKKILSCARQAKHDGLEYFWVDTCCINKADAVELRDAISSMFNWYQHASKCYVYLWDVPYSKQKADTADTGLAAYLWTTAFRRSKWFTRGWTLQELLAPRFVEFFSKEWRKLGDKASLETHIHEATRIPKTALQGVPMLQFTIDERLKWSGHRETTEPEDRVYCLIGIFGAQMTPFYGEGVHGAFIRLMDEANILKRCLLDMCPSDPYDDKKRIEDTKGGLLQRSYDWVLNNNSFQQWRDNSQSCLLWMKGDAGKGKTMLVCGIVDQLKTSNDALLSFFFCQGTDDRINNATSVLRGVIYQLVTQQPTLMSHLREKYDRLGGNLFQDANAWVALSDIFENMTRDTNIKTNYIVVDALDECLVDLPKLLNLIIHTTASSSRIKWLVSSRNEAHIEQKFKTLADDSKLSLELRENAEHVAQAVDIYIDHKLSHIDSLEEEILRERVRDELRLKANGTFLWVALVIQELEKPESWAPLTVVKEAPEGLHELYGRMLDRVQQLSPTTAKFCRSLLCTVVVAYRPLYLLEMGSLCRSPGWATVLSETVRKIVVMCGSFLTIRDEQVYLIHQSAKDFLSDKIRAGALSSYPEIHYEMYTQSLERMSSTLKRDIYTLDEPGISIEEVRIPNPDPLANLRYSCVYWVDHLCDSQSGSSISAGDSKIRDAVNKFIREKYLYWLEGLSLSKNVTKGVESVGRLCSLVTKIPDADELNKLVRDAHRFIMYHKGAIESHPVQIYASALLFSPKHSLMRQLFQFEEPNWIALRPEVRGKWSACLQTIEDPCNMVTFSPNSMQLASASWENTVKIMDASSGTYLQTLEGHTSSVQLVSFSDDSTRLASVSRNGMVIIWNVSSGDCVSLRQLHRANHGLSVHSGLSAFSHDLAWLASRTTSNWETVEILDPISGECLSTIKDFNGEQVRSLTFFHVEKWLAIGLDFTIKIWDCTNSRYIQTLQWHRWTGASHISSATAYNSGLLASGLVNGIIMIFSIDSDEAPRVLISHTRWVISMTFSHDSTRLASASEDRTVKIWDLGNSTCLQTFDGHNSPVVSVAFSYDSTQLASVAEDGITKIWDTSGGESMHAPDSHKNSINAVVFSPDSTRLASSSDDCTIKIWDLNSRCLQTLRGHTNEIEMSVFSHHSVWLASASLDSTVRVWDVISGWCLSIFRGHYDKVVAVAFSHDSVMLASASYDHTVKLWNVSTTKCLLTLADHRHYNTSVAFSNDSTQLASLSTDGTVRVWNTRNGENLQTLNCSKDPPVPRLTHYSSYDPSLSRLTHYSSFKFIALSHDATQLALVSNNGFIEIWERNHSKCLQAIYVGKQLSNVSFHASGLYLSTDVGLIAIPASSDPDERVVAPNLQSTPHYTAGLSIDGKWITYNSINVLRLPSEYRPSRSAVSGDLVAMAVGGRVFICTLSRSCSSK